MKNQILVNIETCFGDIHDPRVQGRCTCSLTEILVIAICGVVAGADLRSIVRVYRERRLPDQVEHETAYYISSLPPDARLILQATRQHWAIENSFHRVLDVTFREDDSRIRQDNSPQNFAVLRYIALNIFKQDTSKGSLKQKRYRAALDEAFLLKLMTQV